MPKYIDKNERQGRLVPIYFEDQILPKTFGALHPERLAFPAAYFYYPLLQPYMPTVWAVRLLNVFSNGILRLLGIRPEMGVGHHITIEELRTLLAESSAVLPRKRHEMMMRVIELGEITVQDIMIPNSEVVGIDIEDSWERALATIRECGYTRLPVYRESMDNVIGVLHVKRADASCRSRQAHQGAAGGPAG